MDRCTRCGGRYDQIDVREVVARYADCDVYKAPCCGRTVDNRRWKSMPDIVAIGPDDDFDDALWGAPKRWGRV